MFFSLRYVRERIIIYSQKILGAESAPDRNYITVDVDNSCDGSCY